MWRRQRCGVGRGLSRPVRPPPPAPFSRLKERHHRGLRQVQPLLDRHLPLPRLSVRLPLHVHLGGLPGPVPPQPRGDGPRPLVEPGVVQLQRGVVEVDGVDELGVAAPGLGLPPVAGDRAVLQHQVLDGAHVGAADPELAGGADGALGALVLAAAVGAGQAAKGGGEGQMSKEGGKRRRRIVNSGWGRMVENRKGRERETKDGERNRRRTSRDPGVRCTRRSAGAKKRGRAGVTRGEEL